MMYPITSNMRRSRDRFLRKSREGVRPSPDEIEPIAFSKLGGAVLTKRDVRLKRSKCISSWF